MRQDIEAGCLWPAACVMAGVWQMLGRENVDEIFFCLGKRIGRSHMHPHAVQAHTVERAALNGAIPKRKTLAAGPGSFHKWPARSLRGGPGRVPTLAPTPFSPGRQEPDLGQPITNGNQPLGPAVAAPPARGAGRRSRATRSSGSWAGAAWASSTRPGRSSSTAWWP